MKPHPVLANILRILNRASYGAVDADEATSHRLTGEARLPEPPGATRDRPGRSRSGRKSSDRRYRGRPLPPPDR
jgi:hypothetical protein